MTLQQLRYFLAAIRHGTLSAAAEACHIAQPSLSEQIRSLERELGVELFVRTTRGLILTDAAVELQPHAEATLASAEEARAAVRGVRDLEGGTVRFGTFSSAHHFILDELLTRFRSDYPKVRLQILGRNSAEIADAVRDGHLEAGLVGLPVDDRGLEVGPVEWAAEVVYLSADPTRVATIPDIVELAAVDLVLFDARFGNADPTRALLLERFQRAGLPLTPAIEVEYPVTALALVSRGLVDTVMSLDIARTLGYADRLHWASLDPPIFERFVFIQRRGARLSPAVAELVDRMRAALHEQSIEPEVDPT
jgi:LysR family transcriptional regulator, cyn operon transcriptional activator